MQIPCSMKWFFVASPLMLHTQVLLLQIAKNSSFPLMFNELRIKVGNFLCITLHHNLISTVEWKRFYGASFCKDQITFSQSNISLCCTFYPSFYLLSSKKRAILFDIKPRDFWIQNPKKGNNLNLDENSVTVFENHQKSLIFLHCDRSELHLFTMQKYLNFLPKSTSKATEFQFVE